MTTTSPVAQVGPAEPPTLRAPAPGQTRALEPAPGGRGPVRFAWKPGPEATGDVRERAGPRKQTLRPTQPVGTVRASRSRT